ncbi:MAG: hypothetical protein RBS43_07530 [Candidatus Cloacimonas sp.]|jgi:hypothetical protein|nr:hypothetical protein [Candidatus Cloacimonas sp.]
MKSILLICLALVSMFLLMSCDDILGLKPPKLDWVRADSLGVNLQAIDISNDFFGFAVGNKTYYFDGSQWILENENISEDIKVISPTCVYTNNYYFNGITWTPIPYQYSGYCVTGTDPSHVWIGDDSGMIHFFNSSSWSTIDLDYSSIKAIDALQSNIVYAVDGSGKVIKYNGIGWSQVYQIPEVQSYYYVTDMKVVSNGDFWVTLLSNPGDQGLIYHFTNDSFTTKWNIDEMINCVDALSSNEVWFGGYSGSIWYYDGSNTLKTQTTESIQTIYDIIIKQDFKYTVGSNGVILKKR